MLCRYAVGKRTAGEHRTFGPMQTMGFLECYREGDVKTVLSGPK